MKFLKLILPLLFLAFCIPAFAEQKDISGRTNLVYYRDTRDYNTLSIITAVKNLPANLSLWGFTDVHGAQEQENNHFDQTRYFMEYRLSYGFPAQWIGDLGGLGVQAEYNDATGPRNDLVRLGGTFKHAFFQGWLQWRAFPYQTTGKGQQFSLIYNIPLIDRFSLSGFADYNLRSMARDLWVVEPQLNYKVTDAFFIVLEYRYNEFEKTSPYAKGHGLAGGFRLQF